MKNLSFLFLVVALALGTVACGNKDKGSSGSSGFSSDPLRVSTVEALINTQTGAVELGSRIYQVTNPQSQQVVMNAFQLAQQQQIQPVLHAGVYKYRARVTGSLGTVYNPQFPQQQQYGNSLNIVSAVIHR